MASIVFDLDGTLIDSAPDLQNVANRILKKAGCPPLTMSETRSFIGNGASVFVNKMCAARRIPRQARSTYLDAFLKAYEFAFELTEPHPGVAEALCLLREQGHQLGVCTNKPMVPCQAVLRHLNLIDHFGAIIAGDSLGVHKPNPEPLHKAIESLGGGRAIYIGDSEIDAQTAGRAGVPFILFTEGYRNAAIDQLTHIAAFDRFEALPSLIETRP